MEIWTSAAPFIGLGGLLCSLLLYFYIKKSPAGTPEMVEISEAIHEGAMAFLKREYTILAGFIVIVLPSFLPSSVPIPRTLSWREPFAPFWPVILA